MDTVAKRDNVTKRDLLSRPVEHIDIRAFDARPVVDQYRESAIQARNLARAADIYSRMLADRDCVVILTLAGSLVSAGLKKALVTLIECDMVDVLVSTGANMVDQDFFEALGFRHYMAPGSPEDPVVSDERLRELAIDRIYDTYIDEDELRVCDETLRRLFDRLAPRPYSSREILAEMGRHLDATAPAAESVVLSAHRKGVPIFVPALSDCSAGFGIALHQAMAARGGRETVSLDSGMDFLELTRIKLAAKASGLLMLGGGVPKNFAQDIVVAAEMLLEAEAAARDDLEAEAAARDDLEAEAAARDDLEAEAAARDDLEAEAAARDDLEAEAAARGDLEAEAAARDGREAVGKGVRGAGRRDRETVAAAAGGASPQEVPMHRYAVQITVADSRDGALSGSTLREATSWGKVDTALEQMVFCEAALGFPLLASDAYHRRAWEGRPERRFADWLEANAGGRGRGDAILGTRRPRGAAM